ncbi:MAG: hypothetical protein MJH10_12270 [Epibacterium sp.]|nr:hypothetical protein [Epibacterium sp.]NQX74324.1 hypothetical protein [Epibacterium sp.]
MKLAALFVAAALIAVLVSLFLSAVRGEMKDAGFAGAVLMAIVTAGIITALHVWGTL